MIKYKIVFTHDPDPDFSWLDDHYDPSSKDYDPVYRSTEDMAAGKPLDADWYRDPENHVALAMLVYAMADEDEDWRLIDSLGNIDFLADGNDWQTGTYYKVDDIPARCAYLRELASDALKASAIIEAGRVS